VTGRAALAELESGAGSNTHEETAGAPGAGAPKWSGCEDELLDARTAGALLTVNPSTLLTWARDGRVPVIRLGPRHLRWTRPMLRQIRDEALDPGQRI
jgi:hypothetical protein